MRLKKYKCRAINNRTQNGLRRHALLQSKPQTALLSTARQIIHQSRKQFARHLIFNSLNNATKKSNLSQAQNII